MSNTFFMPELTKSPTLDSPQRTPVWATSSPLLQAQNLSQAPHATMFSQVKPLVPPMQFINYQTNQVSVTSQGAFQKG